MRRVTHPRSPEVTVAQREAAASLRAEMIAAGVLRPGDPATLQPGLTTVPEIGTGLRLDEQGKAIAQRQISFKVRQGAPGNDALLQLMAERMEAS